jgi:hypothetical protein
MNFRWIRSNEILLTFFLTAVVLVGTLAFLVARQQEDHAIDEIDRQVSRKTVPVMSAPSQVSLQQEPAPTPSKSGISGQAPGQQDTAVVEVTSQGSTPEPAQAPSKSDTSAQARSQQGAAVVDTPSHSSAPQQANTPSNISSRPDTSPKPPPRQLWRRTTMDRPVAPMTQQGRSISATVVTVGSVPLASKAQLPRSGQS